MSVALERVVVNEKVSPPLPGQVDLDEVDKREEETSRYLLQIIAIQEKQPKLLAVDKCSRMNPLDAIKAEIELIELAEIGERESFYSRETVVKEYNFLQRATQRFKRRSGDLAETVMGHIEQDDSCDIGERVDVDTLNIVVGQAQLSEKQVLQASGRHLSQLVVVQM